MAALVPGAVHLLLASCKRASALSRALNHVKMQATCLATASGCAPCEWLRTLDSVVHVYREHGCARVKAGGNAKGGQQLGSEQAVAPPQPARTPRPASG